MTVATGSAGCLFRVPPQKVFIMVILSFIIVKPVFSEDTPPSKPLTFVTAWFPQAQFAGFYVAQEKGFYKKYGLETSILHGGPQLSPFDALEKGRADVGMIWLASAIQKRDQGAPLVNIAQIEQRSALMLVAKKSSGIRAPQDMQGKKVGLWDEIYSVQPKAFFKKHGLQVTIIPQSYSVNLFLRGGVDVASAMWYNEYHTILNAGIDEDELTTFFFPDHGLNFPEDGLYVFENKLAEDPARFRAFVKASLEGWLYAFEHEEEALGIVLRYMKQGRVPANAVHQRWMLRRMKDIVLPAGRNEAPGTLSKEDYTRTSGVLKENGLIGQAPPFASFHKFEGFSGEK